MASKVQRCYRCGKRLRNANSANADGWTHILRAGIVTETLCPACPTPLERAQTAVNETLNEVGLSGEFIMQRPKIRMSTT